MNKKVMAVAVAGALAAPVAMAQTSGVQIGGYIQVFYFQHDPANPSGSSKADRLQDSESNFYVRGEEQLGGGLSVWFQCESSMNGMFSGAAGATGFCTRNSGAGFKSSWGNLFVGSWDTPEKAVANLARGWWGANNALNGGIGFTIFNGGPSSVGNGLTTGAAAAAVNTPAGFFRRQANSINFHSPSYNGFTFQGAYSARNEATELPEANSLKPRLWSLMGAYQSGPLTVALGYERHDDYNPGGVSVANPAGGAGVAAGAAGSAYTGGSDSQFIIMGGYAFGPFAIRGMYVDTEYEVTNATTADTKAWAIFGDWNIQGPHTIRFQYYKLDEIKGNSLIAIGNYAAPMTAAGARTGTGVDGYGIAYTYAFSKRTEGGVVYNRMSNDMNAAFSLGVEGASLGNSQKSMGVQLRHRF
jgi:predicted porin